MKHGMINEYGFGWLTDEMIRAIRDIVHGKTVIDAGAGNLAKSTIMLEAGAKHVIAIDKKAPYPRNVIGEVKKYAKSFGSTFEFRGEVFNRTPKSVISGSEVIFLGWPINYKTGVARFLKQAPDAHVIYLGTNVSPTSCGSAELFTELTRRRIAGVIEHDRNDLIIYEPGRLSERRCCQTREEKAFLERINLEFQYLIDDFEAPIEEEGQCK